MIDWNVFWLKIYDYALAALTQPPGGPGIVTTVGSMYSVEEERMANIARLRQLCDEAVINPAFSPRDGRTFCNFSSRFIAEGMGFFGFPYNTLVNDMVNILQIAPEWREDIIARAHGHAMKGGLAFLALTDEPHGHMVAIYPAAMEPSGTWGMDVPLLANVGASNGIMKTSAVFRAGSPVRCFLFGETA